MMMYMMTNMASEKTKKEAFIRYVFKMTLIFGMAFLLPQLIIGSNRHTDIWK